MGHKVNEGLEISEPKFLSSSWVWDHTVWTRVPSGPLMMSLTYGPRGQVTSLRVPANWDTRRRNMARALATSWQLNIEEHRPMYQSDEVWTMDNHRSSTCPEYKIKTRFIYLVILYFR